MTRIVTLTHVRDFYCIQRTRAACGLQLRIPGLVKGLQNSVDVGPLGANASDERTASIFGIQILQNLRISYYTTLVR
jgi:hypothetical protein